LTSVLRNAFSLQAGIDRSREHEMFVDEIEDADQGSDEDEVIGIRAMMAEYSARTKICLRGKTIKYR